MKKIMACIVICMIMALAGRPGICATFEERFWKKYTEISIPKGIEKAPLAVLTLDPYQLGDLEGTLPFADFRVASDRREEIPFQIISKKPEKREREIPHEMLNLSTDSRGETWIELRLRESGATVNVLELVTPDTDYIRQAEVLGSPDGKTWNVLRSAGVIFDMSRSEKIRNNRISFGQSSFPYLALKIINSGEKPLAITDVRALQQSESPAESYMIPAISGKQENDENRKESRLIVRMEKVFPIDRLIVETSETNFQRDVTVQKKNESGNWQDIAVGTIYTFDTPSMHLNKKTVEMPEVAAREFRLIIRNHDSPPIAVSRVKGEGYQKMLVFKNDPGHRIYLFWGNPYAEKPVYDLAGATERQNLDQLPMAQIGNVRENTKFAGENARRPFTERYRFLLYSVIVLAIAGLFLMQYRIFKRMKGKSGDPEA